MKKVILSILCVLGLSTMASAETYTCVMKNATKIGNQTIWTCEGFTFTAEKNGGTTPPTINANFGDLRIYAKGTLTISAGDVNITSMSFDISSQGLKRATDVTPNTGAIVEQGVNPLVWNGSAKSVALTVGDKAVYGTESDKAGQFDFNSVTITTDGPVTGGGVVIPPVPEGNAVYTATTTIANGDYLIYANDKIATPLEASKTYGYIPAVDATVSINTITAAKANQFTLTAVEGGYTIQDPSGRYYYQTGDYNSFNVSTERIAGDVWTVTVNSDGTVVIKNASVEKSIQFDQQYGSFGSYPDVRGVYPTLYAYTKDAEGTVTPDPEVPVVNSLNDLYGYSDKAEFEMGTDLTVVYANGSYVYVYDGNTYGLIYKFELGLKAGDVIAKGWKGKVKIYNSLVELEPNDATLATAGTVAIPEPVEVEDADMANIMIQSYNQNVYVKLLGVTFNDATPGSNTNFTGVIGEGDDAYTVTFRNTFKLDAVEAGTYDVVAFISVYNSTIQLYPVKYIGESGEVQLPQLETFNILPDLEDGSEFQVAIDLTVVYSNGTYTYVNDGYMNALVYKKGGVVYNPGDVIAKGWKGSLKIYNNLLEIEPISDLTVASTGAKVPAPMDVTAGEVNMVVTAFNQAAYVKLLNVNIEEVNGSTIIGKMGDVEVAMYNRFALEAPTTGLYNVTGFVAVYGDTPQLYVTVFEDAAGIADVAVDANAPVRYYNLQGVEVVNPTAGGLYIQVKGNKVTKVIK